MGRWRRVASLLWLRTRSDWYRGLGVDLGGGRVVQLYCRATGLSLSWWMWAVMAWRRVWSGLSASTSRVVANSRYRRACTAGAHLVLPGCAGGSAPVDIVRVAAADPAAWSHVRRYTIPDMWFHGHPCVVGGQIVLVYVSTSLPPQDARRAVMGAARAVAAWGGRGEAWLPRPPTPPRVHPARAHTLPSHHTHPGCRRRRPALAPGAVRRNGIPGVRRVISGVIDPRGCGRPRPHAAAGTTGVGRCGVAAVRGGAGRRGPHPTPHNHSPCPHGHTECSCAWRDTAGPWRCA